MGRVSRLGLLTIFGLFFASTNVLAEWKGLEALQKQGARVSALVTDLGDGDALQKLHPDTRLSPASITKLVVAAAALDVWPADKTFETRVQASGAISEGRLSGDLVLGGEGDATLDHRDLWQLAGQVRASGVRSVSGQIVVRPPYGPLGCDNADRCEALEHSDTSYNVPMASLGVDYGNWCVEVRPSSAIGKPADLRACGGVALPIAVEGSVTTLKAQAKENFWVERRTREGLDFLQVGGAIGQGESEELFRAMSDPARGAGLLLRQMLLELGVKIEGSVRVSYDEPVTGSGQTLASVHGLALREQLGRMLRFSNNYVADLLTLGIAAAGGAKPATQLAEASASLASFMSRANPKQKETPLIYSGSGLTPENAISATDMVKMLQAQYEDARNFPAFYGGLVVPRQAPYAFLRGGSRAWLDRVALKTGTMNDPRSVCAVAGYLRRKNGGWMAFAILVNGGETMRRVPLHKSMEAIKSDIDDLLERY